MDATPQVDTPQTPERVLVGVDGSDGSVAALRWAHAYAVRTGASLEVVTVFRYEEVVGVPGAAWPVQTYEEVEDEAARRQQRVLDAVVPPGSPVPLETSLVFGNPTGVLLELAATADHLVVGSRGMGGFKGLLLGSVSQQLVHHAPCPVTVVRG